MGDILEDAYMACDTRHDTVLRIGFLNVRDKLEMSEKLVKYKEVFDIVISDDGSLDPVLHLLESIRDQNGCGPILDQDIINAVSGIDHLQGMLTS